LIYSFGWSSADAFVQHDIQELARVLLDSLEDSLPGITNMFKGTMKNYIKCTEVPYESATTESFLDLQLQVLGCKSVLESFYAYTMTEHLTGENIYKCEEYGEQPAIKGVKFLTLPPVLMLHLKRFQFDYRTGRDQKINNRYTFQNEINLSPFVENSTGEDVYCLQSVLVHTGGVSGGHYFNFVKTSLGKSDKDAWYRFDDDRVTRVTDDEAIDANFGGTGSASAYMLCYIRKNLLDLYMRPTTKEDVPTTLQERIERERSSCTIL
jgi:ubiquitin carboxyl-terminal hydrolase 7